MPPDPRKLGHLLGWLASRVWGLSAIGSGGSQQLGLLSLLCKVVEIGPLLALPKGAHQL